MKRSSKTKAIALGLIIFAIAVSALAGYSIRRVQMDSGDEISGNLEGFGVRIENVPEDVVARCISLCRDVKSVSEEVEKGTCLSPDMGKYGCAVVVNGEGHCIRFFRGMPEIVLNEKCEYVGAYVYAR